MTTTYNQNINAWLTASDEEVGLAPESKEDTMTDTKAQAIRATAIANTQSRERTAEIKRIRTALSVAGQDTPDRVLSALGHPGYGQAYSAQVLKDWQANPGQSLHSIVYMEMS